MFQVPSLATVAVPKTVTPSGAYNLMVWPGVPLPVMVGVVSVVMLSVLLVPVSLPAAKSAAGGAGGVVSMVTGTMAGALTLPAGSVAVTLTFVVPSGNAWMGVTLQLPLPATTAVSTSPVGNVTVMVSPAVPVPLISGVVSRVMLSVLLVPVSLAAATSAAGAAGPVASMTNATVVAALVLPAGSVAVTLTLAAPSAKAWVGVTLQVPLAATTVVSTSPVPGMVTVMVSPGVAPAPLMVGVVSVVRLSVLLVPVSLMTATSAAGAAGTTVSSVKLPGAAGPAVPPLGVMVVLVFQTPLTVRAAVRMICSMLPASMSAWIKTVVNVSVVPSGLVTTLVTVSPSCAFWGKRMTKGVPVLLPTSVAFTPLGASGSVTLGARVLMVSSPAEVSMLVLPAGSVMRA